MRKIAAVILFTTNLSLILCARTGPTFEPAYLLSAADIAYPVQSIAVGTVVVEVTTDERGGVSSIKPVHEITSLTETVVKAVTNWQFQPAMEGGKAVRARSIVAVTFNPAGLITHDVSLSDSSEGKQAESVVEDSPARIVQARYVEYPVNAVATGTVILRAKIDADGSIQEIVPLREVAALTEPCVQSLKKWKFEPARMGGNPIPSFISFGFVLRPPPVRN
jgi:outer membrane biosynthesis protein TonB